MANLNLLDVAKLNGSDEVIGLIEEVITEVPELQLYPARTILGTSYKTVLRDGLPSVSFRSANEGVVPGKSTYRDAMIQMYILDGQIEGDKRVIDADERGPAHMLGLEATGIARATLIALASQLYYGTAQDAKGFPGLKAFAAFGGDFILDATGTTATTASSVYGVRFGEQDASMIYGNNATLTLGEWRTEQLTDSADSTKKYTGYVNDLGGWVGLQLANKWCAGRICNLTADSGKGLTEELIHDFLDLYPASKKPHALFLSGRSMTQLRKSMVPSVTIKSRSASAIVVSQSQAIAQVEESTGLRLVVSDSILNTDAIES
jgi:hypothetical protein